MPTQFEINNLNISLNIYDENLNKIYIYQKIMENKLQTYYKSIIVICQ